MSLEQRIKELIDRWRSSIKEAPDDPNMPWELREEMGIRLSVISALTDELEATLNG